jgi:hypothetical protein
MTQRRIIASHPARIATKSAVFSRNAVTKIRLCHCHHFRQFIYAVFSFAPFRTLAAQNRVNRRSQLINTETIVTRFQVFNGNCGKGELRMIIFITILTKFLKSQLAFPGNWKLFRLSLRIFFASRGKLSNRVLIIPVLRFFSVCSVSSVPESRLIV